MEPRRSGRRARTLVTAAATSFVAAAALLAGCGLLPVPTADPGTARAREIAAHAADWLAAGIDSYTMTVTRSCFCPPESIGPFQITVVDGNPTSVTMAGVPARLDRIPGVPLTIPAAFSLLAALDAGAGLTVTWDPTLGFPARADVDPIANAVDDEYSLTISDVRPTG